MGIEIRTVSGYDELGRVDLIAVDGDDPVGIAFVSADPVSRESGVPP